MSLAYWCCIGLGIALCLIGEYVSAHAYLAASFVILAIRYRP